MKHLEQRWGRPARGALAAIAFILVAGQSAPAQDQKLDITEILHDTQKVVTDNGELNFVWWLPDEYWKASATKNATVTPAQVETLMKVIHPYFIVAVASGRIGAFSAVTYRSEEEIRGLLQLKDNDGALYKPLPDDKLDASVPALLGLMKPTLVRMVGALGENTNFYVFPGSRKDGTRVCDPQSEGACEVSLGDRTYKWRLPLGSLLPRQKCTVCGESLSGAYKFCPYDGTKLMGSK